MCRHTSVITSRRQVGCNQNGGVSLTLSDKHPFNNTAISTETALEIGQSIEDAVLFGSSILERQFSKSLAKAWQESFERSTTIDLACDHYDNGDDFTGGCMWQLQLDMEKAIGSGELLRWPTHIVKCTRSSITPKCPPFFKCNDEGCAKCIRN